MKNLNQDQNDRSCSENQKIALRCRIASGVSVPLRSAPVDYLKTQKIRQTIWTNY
jgi:hypothetical protein